MTETRPWGSFTILDEGDGFKVKRISVKPGEKLSLQYHHHRSEHWTVVQGEATVTIGEITKPVKNQRVSLYSAEGKARPGQRGRGINATHRSPTRRLPRRRRHSPPRRPLRPSLTRPISLFALRLATFILSLKPSSSPLAPRT